MKVSGWKFGIQHPSGVSSGVVLTSPLLEEVRKRTALFQSTVFHMGQGQGSVRVEQDATATQDDRVEQSVLHRSLAESDFYWCNSCTRWSLSLL